MRRLRTTMLSGAGICALMWLRAAATLPADSAGDQLATAASVQRPPVTWLLFVDDLHLDFRNTGRLRTALKTIAQELIADSDTVAVGSSGPSSLAAAPTSDRQWLDDAIRKATGNALKLSDIVRDPGISSEMLYRASIAVTKAADMLNQVDSRLQPTALLYITNGYSFEAFPDDMPGQPLGAGRDVSRARVREALSHLGAEATRSGIRVFAIAPPFAEELEPAEPIVQAYLAARRSSLRSISEATGGLAIVDGDLTGELRRVAAAMGR